MKNQIFFGDKKFELRSVEGKYKWSFRVNIEKAFLTMIVAPKFRGLLFIMVSSFPLDVCKQRLEETLKESVWGIYA